MIDLHHITHCPFCNKKLYGKGNACCINEQKHHLFSQNNVWVRIILDDKVIFHYKSPRQGHTKNKITLEIFCGCDLVTYEQDIELDYSDIKQIRNKINMLLAFNQ